MPVSNVFGNILTAAQVEEAALTQLEYWLPTYLREIESQTDIAIGSIPLPEYYSNRNSFDYMPGEKFPKIVAISPGLSGAPVADGNGIYRAVWRLGVGAALAAITEQEVNRQVKIYGAAIRKIMIDNPGLGGLAEATRWVDEQYNDLDIPNQNILFRAAEVMFDIDCGNVSTKWKGPDHPDEDPYAHGRAEHIIIDLEKVALDA